VSCIDELSLRRQKPSSVFLEFFTAWHPIQSTRASEAGSKAIVLKHPLQAFFLDEIFKVMLLDKSRARPALPSSATSVVGTKLPFRDLRRSVATGGKPDMARTAQFGRD